MLSLLPGWVDGFLFLELLSNVFQGGDFFCNKVRWSPIGLFFPLFSLFPGGLYFEGTEVHGRLRFGPGLFLFLFLGEVSLGGGLWSVLRGRVAVRFFGVLLTWC